MGTRPATGGPYFPTGAPEVVGLLTGATVRVSGASAVADGGGHATLRLPDDARGTVRVAATQSGRVPAG